MDTSLAHENDLVLALVHALLGAVSPNMRAVTLSVAEWNVVITFYLAQDMPDDREGAEDVAAEFEATQTRAFNSLELRVVVGEDQWPLGVGSLSGRAVYVRRGM